MGRVLRSLRFAGRMLVKNPASSVIAVLAMALGIALSTTMFGIIDAMLLRGLPFEQADRLLHAELSNPKQGEDSLEVGVHDFADWRRLQTSFEDLAGFTGGTFNLADEGLPERFDGMWISASFLDLLREKPLLGRGFLPEDEQPGAPKVLLLSYAVWQKRYGGDPEVVGRTVRLNSEPTQIVGVLPDGFRFPVDQDLWMPLVLETADVQRGEGRTLEVFGRLRDGVGVEAALLELTTITRQLALEYPKTNADLVPVVKPYVEEFVGKETQGLLGVMMAAVLLVLLIACINVANLLIGRASLRSRELAIRSALGSGRLRAIGLVLAESALLSIAGTAIGLGVAAMALRAFGETLRQAPGNPFWFQFYLDSKAALVAAGLSVVAAIVAGLVPALQASRADVTQVLQDTGRGSTSFRMGWLSRTLVVLEVGISGALLLCAGLTIRSVLAANAYDLKIDTSHLLIARMGLFPGDHPTEDDWIAFDERLLREIGARADVERVALATVVPAETQIGASMGRFERPGESYERPYEMPLTRLASVSPGYFATLGAAILAGRDFHDADRKDTPGVALVNETFARKEWPNESPIGKRINLWLGEEEEAKSEAGNAGWVEVVGLVPDLRFANFDNDDDQQGVYLPLAQRPERFTWIVARTKADPLPFGDTLRRAVLELDPNLPLYFVRTMDQVLESTLFYHRLITAFFTVFGVVALILACIGLYGVMAFAVTQRTAEMGVRMVLGARGADVLRLVLGQGLRQAIVGLVIALGLGTGLSFALKAFLFAVRPGDPLTFVATPLLLLAVAVVACLIPAWRASSVDPMEALRFE